MAGSRFTSLLMFPFSMNFLVFWGLLLSGCVLACQLSTSSSTWSFIINKFLKSCAYIWEGGLEKWEDTKVRGISKLGAVVIDYKNNCYNAAISTPDDVQVFSKKNIVYINLNLYRDVTAFWHLLNFSFWKWKLFK